VLINPMSLILLEDFTTPYIISLVYPFARALALQPMRG